MSSFGFSGFLCLDFSSPPRLHLSVSFRGLLYSLSPSLSLHPLSFLLTVLCFISLNGDSVSQWTSRSSCLNHLSVRMITMSRTPDFEGAVSSCLAHGVAVKSLRVEEDLARQQCLASSAAYTCRETQGGQCRERS